MILQIWLAFTLLEKAKAVDLKFSIAILEKAKEFGSQVSGAVVNPSIFNKVFPNHIADAMPIEAICNKSYFSIMGTEKKWDVPSLITRAAAPDFCKEGYYILTLSQVVLDGKTLMEKAKDVPNLKIDFFPGFAAMEVIYGTGEEANKVIGVRVDRTNDTDDILYAKLTFGDKGFLSKDIIKKFNLETNPQIWSVGVKETWKLANNAEDLKEKVGIHSVIQLDGTLGGGFIYGLQNKRLTIGLVISLDGLNIHPQKQLQEYKKHPWLQKVLDGAS